MQKTERELVKYFLVIIRDKAAASIFLKTKSTVKLCYENFLGDKLHQADFQLHLYLNVPLRLYRNKPKSVFFFVFFYCLLATPLHLLIKSTSLQPTALLLNVILKYNPPSILLYLHMLFCGDISDRFSFLPDINC